ncbi:hypothetical protein ACQCVP_05380 [Rossellomorea vietnamensis]
MFPGEKKAVFPFILRGLFDPEWLSPFQWVRTLGRWSWIQKRCLILALRILFFLILLEKLFDSAKRPLEKLLLRFF